ncbi:protein of unknown function [Tistlia consotensis]|uniref:DUF4864 domain-containing protein n=1 Tax=Tistlia consotensis USBA 355 TaxID=560819 RepID=A0A1Y6B5S7_9PROT|nr:DUF4864 domain-containing protein [Tistlia consotensis]SME93789.1 protein of unknown function [Tistlia consotensis USBA 355]SNR28807.1 protein of unknown function [Tistlia consotensis]
MANPRSLPGHAALPVPRSPVLLLPILLLVAGLLAAAPARAQDAEAIRAVIGQQLDAFRRDDGGAAFSYASPGIQARFGNAATFMEMVRAGYPAVYRPLEVEFRKLSLEDGKAVQEVYFVGADGKAALALYLMERQPDGSWRINGVRMVALPETIS